MGALAYWAAHVIVAFFGLVLLGLSVRAFFVVFGTLCFEFISLISMFFPQASVLGTFGFSACAGFMIGAPLSIGRDPGQWWALPALGGGVLVFLRGVALVDDWQDGVAVLPLQLATVVGYPAGILAGRLLRDAFVWIWVRGANRAQSKKSSD